MRHDLLTEAQNPASAGIDALPTIDMLRVINAADQAVAVAVERELPNIARAVDARRRAASKWRTAFLYGGGDLGQTRRTRCF